MDAASFIEVIRAQLDASGHQLALAGAFALRAHGLARETHDLDLIVPFEAQEALVALLERLGFEIWRTSTSCLACQVSIESKRGRTSPRRDCWRTGMRSNADDGLLDLERGLPTTPGDVEALRRHRPGPMTFAEYLRFLQQAPPLPYETLRARPGPRGPPFRL